MINSFGSWIDTGRGGELHDMFVRYLVKYSNSTSASIIVPNSSSSTAERVTSDFEIGLLNKPPNSDTFRAYNTTTFVFLAMMSAAANSPAIVPLYKGVSPVCIQNFKSHINHSLIVTISEIMWSDIRKGHISETGELSTCTD